MVQVGPQNVIEQNAAGRAAKVELAAANGATHKWFPWPRPWE